MQDDRINRWSVEVTSISRHIPASKSNITVVNLAFQGNFYRTDNKLPTEVVF